MRLNCQRKWHTWVCLLGIIELLDPSHQFSLSLTGRSGLSPTVAARTDLCLVMCRGEFVLKPHDAFTGLRIIYSQRWPRKRISLETGCKGSQGSILQEIIKIEPKNKAFNERSEIIILYLTFAVVLMQLKIRETL